MPSLWDCLRQLQRDDPGGLHRGGHGGNGRYVLYTGQTGDSKVLVKTRVGESNVKKAKFDNSDGGDGSFGRNFCVLYGEPLFLTSKEPLRKF